MRTFPHKKWNPFIHLDHHEGVFLNGPIPVPGTAWHLAAGCMVFPWWYMGGKKNNDDKVLANGMPIVSRLHEPKYLIVPHWNMFPFTPGQPNILMPLLILGSGSKCEFAVGSVRGKDGAIAVSVLCYVGVNLACADPCNMPTCMTINWGSVVLGFTWGDLLAGILCGAYDALKSFLENKFFGWLGGKLLPKGLLKGPMLNLLRRFGLPKVFRAAGGKFASLAGKLGTDTVIAITKLLYGELYGGNLGVDDPIGNAAANGAERLGAWVDGRSEPVN